MGKVELEAIQEIALKHSLELVITSNASKYHETAQKISPLLVDYQYENIQYQEEYFKDCYNNYLDITLLMIGGGGYIGIWPLFIADDGNCFLGSTGKSVIPPLVVPGSYNYKTYRKTLKNCMDFLKEIAVCYNIRQIQFEEIVMGEPSLWHKIIMEEGGGIQAVTHQLFYNLELNPTKADKMIAKLALRNIKRGRQLFDYHIVTRKSENIDEIFAKFRAFHIRISGRETRNIKTWERQSENLKSSNDFIVELFDKKTGKLEGMSLFLVTNSAAYYGVGVYERADFDRPVSHVAHAVAIDYMRQLGLSWYEIGERSYIQEKSIDKKKANIGFFKETLSTDMFLKLHEKIELT